MQPPVVACIKQMLPWQIQLWLHTLQLTVDGQAFLTVSQQPPDAHRGVDVPAALLSLQAPDDAVTQVVSTGVLVQLATPDISMGYNVICLSSTVMAVYVGAVLTALTKRMDQVK
ncbi:uncharacterized protein HaLaN_11257 [Haematococcus lacustris]|uniref:Uncharacterized protein n=1 Tax=Haematococcus lacustris TaxID=44745 RepID=A0A699ZHH5_HAELA|nr:uncharacterized protein HaLaN_11257 [Haematococcus lacustris]